MSTLSNKLVAACMVTAISMVMYGCGGGGGGSSDDEMTMMPPPTTPEPPTCAEGEVLQDGACVTAPPTVEEVTKAANTKKEAIAVEAAQLAADQLTRGLGGDTGVAPTDSNAENEYNLNIKYGETSIVKEVDGDADNNVTFTQAMDFGGGTTMHVLTMDADDDGNVVEEVAIVSTDIEAPKATAFAMVDGQALDVDLDPTTDGPDADNTADNDFTALDVDETATGITALITSSAFTAGTAAVLTFADDDTTTTGTDETFQTPGTYNGADGTYRCNGTADCTVTLDAMGMITAISDGWVFIPDEGATSDVPDADYLNYGFWLKRTTDKDGVLTYDEVETFAGSSIPQSTGLSSVTGRATYSGGATGVYVHSVTNPDGTEASATSGHFTADVALTAHFAQTVDDPTTDNVNEAGQIPPALLNRLSGTINNFTLSGHDQGPGWSVSMEPGEIVDDGTASGMAKGGGAGGNYSASFRGPTTDDTQPHSVVGEFDALFSNGSVAGGFGARKDAE